MFVTGIPAAGSHSIVPCTACVMSWMLFQFLVANKKGIPYSIAECRVPELIPVLGSQSAGDVSHKPGGRLPLLSARPAVCLRLL